MQAKMMGTRAPVDQVVTLTEVLQAAPVGARMWFWLCPEAAGEGPPLILSPLADDPTMEGLMRRVNAQPMPVGARFVQGLASVAADGRLQLAAMGLTKSDLLLLAIWVNETCLLYTSPSPRDDR